MNRKVMSLILVSAMGCAVQAFAQEDVLNNASNNASHREALNSSDMTPLEKKAMQECLVKEIKTADDNKSVGDMRKYCQAQVRIRSPKDEAKLAAPGASTTKP